MVLPYIESFPESRVQWYVPLPTVSHDFLVWRKGRSRLGRVYNILEGRKEVERVLWKDDDPELGFLVLPDLKWDQSSMSDLVNSSPPNKVLC